VASKIDELCVNTIRFLAVDAIEKAKSGHPGMPLGAAPMAYCIWDRFLKHNPSNPKWPDRDRFVLSAGHSSAMLYALLHLTGYDLPLDEIMRFRQWGSMTPGHPEYGLAPGVETTTGPLGQGFGNAVGMAIAEEFLASRFNRPGFPIVDHYTYVIASDGDIMEGVCQEAASIAGHLKLGKLIVLYDSNRVTIEGSTDLAFSEDVGMRFSAYGWHVQEVEDGNDIDSIEMAIRAAREERERPSLIIVRTHIGYGSPKQDSPSAHGEPLGEEATRQTKANLGWPEEPSFYIPQEALSHFRKALERGRDLEERWKEMFSRWAKEYPDLAEEWEIAWSGRLPDGWDEEIPKFPPLKPIATRNASGEVLSAIAKKIPNLIGGSADLAPSNKSYMPGEGDFSAKSRSGRNIHFGIREHAMGAISNGMALHGGVIPYCATFLVFSDYMRPSIRLAAMMRLPVIYIFTHDSIGVGEDGPTHQPVEQIPALRAIPNLTVIRPADANETAMAWKVTMDVRKEGPVALLLSRQNLPVLDPALYPIEDGVPKGAYVLSDSEGGDPDLILIASGSEVHLALSAKKALEENGIRTRVVSMPSWELFEKQPEEYRSSVLPPNIKARISIEAASPFGWHKWAISAIGVEEFGRSAPADILMREYGFTVERIVEKAKEILGM
jgi:transketolase